MKLHGSLWRGAALALLFLVLITGVCFSQSETPVELQSEVQAELQAVPPGWKIETIDDGRLISELGPHSLAYGPGGVPHVAYGSDHLYHAWYDGANWVIEMVDSSPMVGTNASIAVDSVGHVYISYYDAGNKDLKFATNWYNGWQASTIASTGDIGSKSYIFAYWDYDLDAPELNLGYLDATNHSVMLMDLGFETNGYWRSLGKISGDLNVSNFAMTMHGVGQHISIAAAGNIYYWTSSNWSNLESVAVGKSITAIAVDGSGTPYIPILEYDEFNLKYLTYLNYREASGWVGVDYPNLIYYFDDPVPETFSISYNPTENKIFLAMQLKDTDNSHHKLIVFKGLKGISETYVYSTAQLFIYGDLFAAVAVPGYTTYPKAGVVYLSAGNLKYEYLPPSPAAENWQESIINVDFSNDTGNCAVVKADNSGKLHLMYYRSDTGALLYRFSTPTGWSSQYTIVDTSTVPDEWAHCSLYSRPSMDLLSDGSPVFSYVNSADQLIYAKWSCGRVCGFSHEVLDTGVTEGSTAVAIGSADNPNVLYHKSSHLKFAYKSSPGALTWSYTAVIDSLDTYFPLSMETDQNGKLHAAFVDMMYDHPRYARFGFGGEYWSNISLLEPTDYTFKAVNIAVNPVSNFPQVAFIVSNLPDDPLVVRAYSTALDWNSRTTIDSSPDLLSAPSFTIDSAGSQLFAYYYKNPGQGVDGLKLMKRTGSMFSPIILEPSIGLIDTTSIALRPGNVPVIAYHVPALGSIKVAWGPQSVFLPLIRR